MIGITRRTCKVNLTTTLVASQQQIIEDAAFRTRKTCYLGVCTPSRLKAEMLWLLLGRYCNNMDLDRLVVGVSCQNGECVPDTRPPGMSELQFLSSFRD